MADRRVRSGISANHIFNGPAHLSDLENVALSGAHLHFNGPFDLRDLVAVDLRNTTLIINDYQGIPPCSGCGKPFAGDQAQLLDPTAILPPTPATQISTDETDVLQSPSRKKLRKHEPSEDGELGPSSPASRLSIKPLASELHPDRVAMLRDPSPEVEAEPVKFISRTKANCLEMPFNRLEQRQFQRAMTNFSTSINVNLVPQERTHLAMGVDHISISSDGAEYGTRNTEDTPGNRPREVHPNTSNNEERVDSFLRTLEPVVPLLSQQPEQFGRLSPVPGMESELPETPGPSASPARLQLEGELETYILRKHGGAELEISVKGEMEK